MEYAFGNVLICKDFNTAKRIAFHEQIKKKCVTLEGDVVNPAGVFEGGALPKDEPMLKSLQQIMQCEEQLKIITEELKKIEELGEVHKKWVELNDQLEVKQHELGVMEKAMQNRADYQLQEEIENLKKEIGRIIV